MSIRPYYANIEKDSVKNNAYRHVQYTDNNIQVVLMTLKPKEEIGEERHPDISQFFRVEQGSGLALIEGKGYILSDGIALVVPPGQLHNIINTSDNVMKLYTIYSSPQHPPKTYQIAKPLED